MNFGKILDSESEPM